MIFLGFKIVYILRSEWLLIFFFLIFCLSFGGMKGFLVFVDDVELSINLERFFCILYLVFFFLFMMVWLKEDIEIGVRVCD